MLHQLRTSKDIVIRLQDKGSRFVVLDRTDYIDKVESNLGDGSFDLLPSDPSLAYYQIVKDWGTKWVNKGEITQPLLDCILNVRAKPGKNYGLIKTHKPNNPIRLITSGNGTVIENLSVFTEYFLHPCINKEPQILADTTALLKKVEDINHRFSPFPAGTLLVSWDVISMYPSIDNEVGLSSCKAALNRREKFSPSTDCLLEAIKITLECNNSTFNNKHYRQNRGTAIGPHNACSYADLAMTTIDHKILDTNNRPNDIIFPPDWSRFRDDCFSPWFGGIPALLEFTEWLNSLSHSIKFTVKYSEVQLEVLDTLLFIINGRIESRVYFRPTDSHMYLLPQSSHHPSLYRNIPFGVALRLRRICSRDDWFDEQLDEYYQFFKRRKYKDSIIRKGFDQARNTPRSNALLRKSRANDTRRNLVLIMDYHPNLKDLPKLIKSHLPTLYESPRMRKLFSNDKVQIRTGFRRTKNLKDLLVPSSLPDIVQENCTDSDNISCYRCHRQVCDACQNFLIPAKRIKSVVTRKSYKIRQSLSCRTDYVIYCAICTLCNRQCVGSCINFRSRLSNHKSHIKKNKRTCRLVNHFIDNSCSHTLADLKFVLIEQVATKTDTFLEHREGYWQAQLWTYEPHGFNAKKEFNSGRRREFLS